ncbi:hypothetical protein DB35_24725 [Streptomyces abyssalis]|uniref:Uncharacterized protein n=1 Tax=Streptomyces abyssalis TaxID=933944 RepID=A0A1E7JNH1_9ACTN|nr:hypothetical protein [Streptomyces abyssalis]OEU86821.1 hypothetical protein DB35_24725 [Streptomyces abyssalis]OEU89795.1 hypothetical protein AN215_08840 [Streptomyces abyssalis]OEV06581.1 hypothetical protein AN219_34160 [Streptomyces nanshensis]
MGNTSFIVLRTARQDGPGPAEPRTQFAELTGAYWLEPIYAGLANEWNRQGRTVPGAPREHRRVLPDGSSEPGEPDTHVQRQTHDGSQNRDERQTDGGARSREETQRHDGPDAPALDAPALDGRGSRPALLAVDLPE